MSTGLRHIHAVSDNGNFKSVYADVIEVLEKFPEIVCIATASPFGEDAICTLQHSTKGDGHVWSMQQEPRNPISIQKIINMVDWIAPDLVNKMIEAPENKHCNLVWIANEVVHALLFVPHMDKVKDECSFAQVVFSCIPAIITLSVKAMWSVTMETRVKDFCKLMPDKFESRRRIRKGSVKDHVNISRVDVHTEWEWEVVLIAPIDYSSVLEYSSTEDVPGAWRSTHSFVDKKKTFPSCSGYRVSCMMPQGKDTPPTSSMLQVAFTKKMEAEVLYLVELEVCCAENDVNLTKCVKKLIYAYFVLGLVLKGRTNKGDLLRLLVTQNALNDFVTKASRHVPPDSRLRKDARCFFDFICNDDSLLASIVCNLLAMGLASSSMSEDAKVACDTLFDPLLDVINVHQGSPLSALGFFVVERDSGCLHNMLLQSLDASYCRTRRIENDKGVFTRTLLKEIEDEECTKASYLADMNAMQAVAFFADKSVFMKNSKGRGGRQRKTRSGIDYGPPPQESSSTSTMPRGVATLVREEMFEGVVADYQEKVKVLECALKQSNDDNEALQCRVSELQSTTYCAHHAKSTDQGWTLVSKGGKLRSVVRTSPTKSHSAEEQSEETFDNKNGIGINGSGGFSVHTDLEVVDEGVARPIFFEDTSFSEGGCVHDEGGKKQVVITDKSVIASTSISKNSCVQTCSTGCGTTTVACTQTDPIDLNECLPKAYAFSELSKQAMDAVGSLIVACQEPRSPYVPNFHAHARVPNFDPSRQPDHHNRDKMAEHSGSVAFYRPDPYDNYSTHNVYQGNYGIHDYHDYHDYQDHRD